MKVSLLCFLFIALSLLLATVHGKCGTDHAMDSILGSSGSEARLAFLELHRNITEMARHKMHERTSPHYRVPIVFHILQNENVPVITEHQVRQELYWLNDWYTTQNRNYGLSSTYWTASIAVASDFEISFELAAFDPQGVATNGIIYHQNSQIAHRCTGTNFYQPSLGGIALWNTLEYYNIILCNILDPPGALGFAYLPQPTTSAFDGCVLSINEFGYAEYSGSTIAHETGHWLGLPHTFSGCTDGDFVDDTPPTNTPSFNHYINPYCPIASQNALGQDANFLSDCDNVSPYMTQNNMDYNIEDCVSYFSKGQVARMRSFLAVGTRSGLTTSPGLAVCVPNCSGKRCGDDGCGGLCNYCPFNYQCVNFQCNLITGNEVCTGAISIPISYLPMDAIITTVSTGPFTDPCGSTDPNNPVWYTISSPTTQQISISTHGSRFDTVISVFTSSSTCPSLTCYTFNDDVLINDRTSLVEFCATASQTYIFTVFGFRASSFGELHLLITAGVADGCGCTRDCLNKVCGDDGCGSSCGLCDNDEACVNGQCSLSVLNELCTGAEVIPFTLPVTRDVPSYLSFFANEACVGGNSMGYNALWYTITPTTQSTITISTIGTAGTIDTIIAVYNPPSSCSSLTCLGFNDDAISGGEPVPASRYSFCASTGVTYLFSVLGKASDDFGTLRIRITGTSCPVDYACVNNVCQLVVLNEYCVSPVDIPMSSLPLVTSVTTYSTPYLNDPCWFQFSIGYNSLFYTITPPFRATITISLDGTLFDSLLSVYSTTDCMSLDCFASNDDINYPTNLASRVSFCAQAGTTYMFALMGVGPTDKGNVPLSISYSTTVPGCTCTAQCAGKQCGDNLCGGSCGTCSGNSVCTANQCVCTPQCAGKQCGDDGCGGSCGTCSGNSVCTANQCVCTPQCAGKQCGDDGCGGTCGTCTGNSVCTANQCVCTPNCAGKQCGDDGCGGTCGSCTGNSVCTANQCVCTPQCAGKQCGDDGCGGSCGTCSGNSVCTVDQCVCTPQCAGKQCGDDGCGGSCGTCSGNSVCTVDECVCTPNCAGKQCGDDGCGGTCGSCAGNSVCTANQCVCTPQCAGKQCGDDGCGGACGFCNPDDNQICISNLCICVQTCGGRVCGNDGCGGTCGTCRGDQTCLGGACQLSLLNELCTGAEVLTLPVTSRLYTSYPTGFTNEPCVSAGSLGYNALWFTFTATTFAEVSISVSSANSIVIGIYSLPSTCAALECLTASQSGVAQVCANVGETYLFSVMGRTTVDVGDFTMSASVTPVVGCGLCEPDCAGKQCGDDGCSGSCGTCTPDRTCTADQCELVVLNELCGDAESIGYAGLPYSTTITTYPIGFTNEACVGGSNIGYNVLWYSITLPEQVTIAVSTVGTSASRDTIVSVYTSDSTCESLSCLAYNDNAGSLLASTLTFCGDPGTYLFSIQGKTAADYGTTSLSVSAQPCRTGDYACISAQCQLVVLNELCNGAVDLAPGTYTITSYPSGFTNEPCVNGAGKGYNALWYTTTPNASPNPASITISTSNGYDTVLALYTISSTCASLTCASYNDDALNPPSSLLQFCAAQNQRYLFSVLGATTTDYGTVTLDITMDVCRSDYTCSNGVCELVVLNELCTNPVTINYNTLPYSTAITSYPTGPTVEICLGYGHNALWYVISPSTQAQLDIFTAGTSGVDTAIGVYAGIVCSPATCVASNDDVSLGDTTSRVSFCADVATYLIAVMGNQAMAYGNIQLSVSASLQPGCGSCIPNCNGKQCGDDGCGGSCGTCTVDRTCNVGSSQCDLVVLNELCDGAVVIPFIIPLPAGVTITTYPSGTVNDACSLSGFNALWYTITPTVQTQLAILVTGTAAPMLGVYTGASCASLSCTISDYNPTVGGLARVEFCAAALQTYTFAVLGARQSDFGEFTLSISSQPCALPNQQCDNAIPFAIGDSIIVDVPPTTFANDPCFGSLTLGYNAVYYTVSSTSKQTIIISTLGTVDSIDTLIAVYPDCSTPVCVTSNDNFAPPSSYATVLFCADVGETFTFAVMGVSPSNYGEFHISISTTLAQFTCTCTPDCSGKQCGDDGCGGSCGTCTPDRSCNAGTNQCDLLVLNELCDGAIPVSAPYNSIIVSYHSGITIEPCYGGVYNALWYSISSTVKELLIFSVSGVGINAGVTLYSGNNGCGGVYCITGDISGGTSSTTGVCTSGSTESYLFAVVGEGDLDYGLIELSIFSVPNCGICVPDCTAKQCGSDGCGGSCGSCPSSDYLCNVNTCELVNTQCPAATVVDFNSLSYSSSITTSVTGPTNEPCFNGLGQGYNAIWYTITPTRQSLLEIVVSATYNAGIGLYSDCALSTCITSDPNQLLYCADAAVPLTFSVVGLQAGDFGDVTVQVNSFLVFGCGLCVPNCAGKECGDDGCGGTCGTCTADRTCNAGTNQCDLVVLHETCEGALVVPILSGTFTDTSYPSGIDARFCAVGKYNALWYKLMVTPPAYYQVYFVRPSFNGELDLYSSQDGTCNTLACEQGGIGGVNFCATNSVYYFAVFGNTPSDYGEFTVSISSVPYCGCYYGPDCSGKQCGSDGCGGSCGTCSSDYVCNLDTSRCDLVVLNELCSGAILLPTDGTVIDVLSYPTGVIQEPCGASVNNGLWYYFQSTVLSTYTITATASFQTSISLFSGNNQCGSLSCFDFTHSGTLIFCGQPSADYLFVVGGANDNFGDISLSISAVAGCRAPNAICTGAQAILPADIPLSMTVTSTRSGFELESCAAQQGNGFNALWYSVSNTAQVQVTILVTTATDFDVLVGFYSGSCGSLVCESFTPVASAICAAPGSTYLFSVLGVTTNDFGPLDLSVTYVFDNCGICIPDCAGKACGDDGCGNECGTCSPDRACNSNFQCELTVLNELCGGARSIDFSSLPFTAVVENFPSGFTGEPCLGGFGLGHNALWYSILPDRQATITISTAGTNSVDTALSVYSSSSSCQDLNCLRYNDDISVSLLTSEVTICANSLESYLFAVMGLDSLAYGSIQLSVTATPGCACVPNCSGFDCGDDGCGGTCGICAADSICVSSRCELSVLNELCSGAISITSFPFTAVVTNYPTGFTNEPCLGPFGFGYNPLWYTVTSPVSSTIVISTRGTISSVDTILTYYTPDSTCSSLTCINFSDDTTDTSSLLSFCADAGKTYLFLVEGATADDFGNIHLSVTSAGDNCGVICAPNCAGKQCGADTCGGFCGTCPINNNCVNNLCVPITLPSSTPSATPTRSITPTTTRTPSPSSAPSTTRTASPSGVRPSVTSTKSVSPVKSTTPTASRSPSPSPVKEITPSNTASKTRSKSESRTVSKSITGSVTPSKLDEPTHTASATRNINESPSRFPTVSKTPSVTRSNTTDTPVPPNDDISVELLIVLQQDPTKGALEVFSTQKDIEDLIASELNNGAEVTVVKIDSTSATVVICDTTEKDLDNLLSAFEDGTFKGTVLDGASVDTVDKIDSCAALSSVDLYSSSSNIDTVTIAEPSSANSLVPSVSFALLFLYLFSLLW